VHSAEALDVVRRKWMKKWGIGVVGLAAVAGIIALGAGIFGGVAQAQEPTDEDSSWHELYQQALADKLGVTVDELQAAQEDARNQVIDDAVASGRITEDQADRLRNAEPGDLRHGFGMRVRHAIGNALEKAADILGLTTDEVRQGFADGKTLNDMAAEQGVTDLESQLVSQLTADIQAKVDDGTITQDQADRMLENLADRVSNLVNHEPGQIRDRMGDRFGDGFGGHFGPSEDAPTQN
jgi:polyhydroxyalkanoate synthesis regulator phasin